MFSRADALPSERSIPKFGRLGDVMHPSAYRKNISALNIKRITGCPVNGDPAPSQLSQALALMYICWVVVGNKCNGMFFV